MKKYSLTLFVAFLAVLHVAAQATAQAAPQAVTDGFKRVFPDSQVTSISKAATGLYEVISDGSVFYATEDGKFLLVGSLLDVDKKLDLTENTKKRIRREAIARVGDDKMVTYAPDNYRYTVNVFTDVDCSYCRKFHGHIPELKKLGIRVNYLLVPFRGDEARARAIGVWCARDRNAALDRAKQGKDIPLKQCDNPVDDHMRLAKQLGIRGTPGIVLASGNLARGYMPPKKLLEVLKRDAL